MRLDNAIPNASTCRSLELGVIRCIDEIMEQVRRNTGLSVTDMQVERVLNGSPCSLDKEAKEIIQRHGRFYAERILSAIAEAGFDKSRAVCFHGRRLCHHEASCNAPGWSLQGCFYYGCPCQRCRV
jgi:plasmid segregation protein ParM